jgi:hypothetical protein
VLSSEFLFARQKGTKKLPAVDLTLLNSETKQVCLQDSLQSAHFIDFIGENGLVLGIDSLVLSRRSSVPPNAGGIPWQLRHISIGYEG